MKINISKTFLLAVVTGVVFSCADESKETSIPTEEITFTKEGELNLLKEGEITHSIDIEIADKQYEWETGLMYRNSLGGDQGMLFVYSNEAPRSFWMKDTQIPLDIIFYDKDSSVVSIHENAVPYDLTSIPSGEPAQFILEVNAGKADEWNIETGDKMKFTRD